MPQYYSTLKNISLILMIALYIIAGINHFINPVFYENIMPSYIPWHIQLIYISGFIEIFLGILLIPKKTRRLAAWGIIFLLISIFPANINMMITYWKTNHTDLWITILRLPLQFVLIFWAYIFAKKNTYTGK